MSKTVTIGGETIEITARNEKEYEAFIAASQKRDAWPRKGDSYVYISNGGGVDLDKWDCLSADYDRQAYGNIYRTEAEALAVVEKRKAQARIDAVIREKGLEFVPDWERPSQRKYIVFYETDGERFRADEWELRQHLSPFYAATEADANAIIAACEADLKIVLGVK